MKHSNVTKVVIAALALGLTACNGGGGDGGTSGGSGAATQSINGKVIDGYISGAKVYLDLNFNGQHDSNEPSTTTAEDGSWTLTGDSCVAYVPLITDVPVGAVDSDLGEITEAYQMVTPPQFALSTDDDVRHVTPLTTAVWSEVQLELSETLQDINSCADVMNNQSVRESITDRLQQQETRVALRYNVTAADLYGDFIESGDTQLHQFAMDLVPGFQKSYAETRTLVNANPGAIEVWVDYILGDEDFDADDETNWYRQQLVRTATTEDIVITLVGTDLETPIGTLMMHEYNYSDIKVNDGITRHYVDTNHRYVVENLGTYCYITETTGSEDDNGMDYVSYTNYGDNTDWDACYASAKTDNIFQSTIRHRDDSTGKGIFLWFENASPDYILSVLGVSDTLQNTTHSDLANLTALDSTLGITDAYGSTRWTRTLNEQSGDDQIFLQHNHHDVWSRQTMHADFTSTLECSRDNANWVETNARNCDDYYGL